jgi:hypothetical protein
MIDKTEENATAWEAAEEHLDRLLDAAKSLEPSSKIILVGPNASGKSLFRKLINKGRKKPLCIVHASMQLRTESRPDMGALSSIAHDWPDNATSYSTLRALRMSINSVKENCALHIDEPEIGFSEELQAGAGTWLRKQLEALQPQPVITLITTHSREVARAFPDWKLIDLGWQFKTVDEWTSREIKPADPEAILEAGQILFSVIQTRINKATEKKRKEKNGPDIG